MNENKEFIMSPKVDYAFQLIFGREETKPILVSFLSAVLDCPVMTFKGITFTVPEQYPLFPEDHKSKIKFTVEFEDRKRTNIEIHVPYLNENMSERTMYHMARMLEQQLDNVELENCNVISVLDFNVSEDREEEAHSELTMRNASTNEPMPFSEMMVFHQLELKKIDPSAKDLLTQWLKFLNAKTKEQFETVAKAHKEMQEAYHILLAASQNPEQRAAYEARKKEILDQIEVERVQKENTAKSMLQEGKTVEQAAKSLRLPIETVQRIQGELP